MELTQKKTWIQLLQIVLLFFLGSHLISFLSNEVFYTWSDATREFVFYPLKLILLIVGGVLITKRKPFEFQKVTLKMLVGCILLLFLTWVVANGINITIDKFYPVFINFSKSKSSSELLWMVPVFIAPLLEELFFRGILFRQLERVFNGPVIAIVLGGLFFGLVHSSLPQMIFNTILGIGYCYVYWKTRNIGVTIFGHFLQNVFFHF